MEKTTPEKKTQRSIPTLHKKLYELESELKDVFRLPLKTPRGQQDSFNDVAQRINFLTNLHTREVASHEPQNTDELYEIGERIAALEDAFHHWNSFRTRYFDLIDTLSVCSDCTVKFDDGRESDASVSPPDDFDSPVSVPENLFSEESPENPDGEELPEKLMDVVEKEEAGAKRVWGFGKFCGVFGSGMIFGALLMVNYLNSFDFPQNEFFPHLQPT